MTNPLRPPPTLRIVSNIENLPAHWTVNGVSGESIFADTLSEFDRYRDAPGTIFLVNCAARLLLELALRRLLTFRSRPPLVALDFVVLLPPRTLVARAGAALRKLALRKVDLFLNYFTDVGSLQKHYGVQPARCGFVDFKANLWDYRVDQPQPDGDYVLCFGRSLRDFDTFFSALELSGLPGAILEPRLEILREHGSRFSPALTNLPKNLRVLKDDGSERSQVDALRNARIVAIPMVKGRVIAAGISTILNAMALGKAVIASGGPGVSDIFADELISVPIEDPNALAQSMKAVWNDDSLRERTATAGWNYAIRCGSESDFNDRVIKAVVAWAKSRN